jgi:hypothetical protein
MERVGNTYCSKIYEQNNPNVFFLFFHAHNVSIADRKMSSLSSRVNEFNNAFYLFPKRKENEKKRKADKLFNSYKTVKQLEYKRNKDKLL